MEILKKYIFFSLLGVLHCFLLAIVWPSVAYGEGENADLSTEEIPLEAFIELPPRNLPSASLHLFGPGVSPTFLEPKVVLFNSNNKQIPLKSLRGKVLVMYFFASWCSSCAEELKSLEKLQNELKFLDLNDVYIMPISVDYKDTMQVQNFFNRLGLRELPLYSDPNKSAMGILGVKSLPTTIMVDSQGYIFDKIEKNIPWARKDSINQFIKLIEEKRAQENHSLSKKHYDKALDSDIIFHKEPQKKVTIIN